MMKKILQYIKQHDKWAHVTASFLIVLLFRFFGNGIGYSWCMSMFIGMCKEFYDAFIGKTGFDRTDLLYDLFGSVIGVAVLIIINIL